MLEKDNRGVHAENLAVSQLQKPFLHFYLCVQRKTNAFLDAYGSFWKSHEVSQSCNMSQLGVERCISVSVLSVDMF